MGKAVQTSPTKDKPKSFFKMKLLQDLAKKKEIESSEKETSESSSSNSVLVAGDLKQQKNLSDGEERVQEVDSVVKEPQKKEAEIDVEELIPSLSSFDPSLMDFLPHNLQVKAKERVNFLKEKEKKTLIVGSVASFLNTKTRKETEVEDVDNSVECEVCRKKVSAFTLPEHLDWHYAVTLSKQAGSRTEINKPFNKPTNKRKRDSVSELSENGKKSKNTDISKFFIKS